MTVTPQPMRCILFTAAIRRRRLLSLQRVPLPDVSPRARSSAGLVMCRRTTTRPRVHDLAVGSNGAARGTFAGSVTRLLLPWCSWLCLRRSLCGLSDRLPGVRVCLQTSRMGCCSNRRTSVEPFVRACSVLPAISSSVSVGLEISAG